LARFSLFLRFPNCCFFSFVWHVFRFAFTDK
jgi:hypothetical protein